LGFVIVNSEAGDAKPVVDDTELDDVEIPDEAVLMDKDAIPDEIAADTDNVGDVSVEINVEELIADIEAHDDKDAARKREIRRRLEDAVEDQAFEDTYAIDLGEAGD
jgi:hypothetical protein